MKIAAIINSYNAKDDDIEKTVRSINYLKENSDISIEIINYSYSKEYDFVNIINNDVESDLIQILRPGDILLPGFYKYMYVSLDHSKKDFCFSHYYSINEFKVFKNLSSSQFLLKKWVVNEIGACDFGYLYSKVVNQYNGFEIPTVLVVG